MSSTDSPSSWVSIGALAEFPEGAIVPREIAGRPLIIITVNGSPLCFNDECAHQPVKLSEFGELGPGGYLMCHAHGACFDLKNGGLPLCFPATEALTEWKTRVVGGNLEVLLP